MIDIADVLFQKCLWCNGFFNKKKLHINLENHFPNDLRKIQQFKYIIDNEFIINCFSFEKNDYLIINNDWKIDLSVKMDLVNTINEPLYNKKEEISLSINEVQVNCNCFNINKSVYYRNYYNKYYCHSAEIQYLNYDICFYKIDNTTIVYNRDITSPLFGTTIKGEYKMTIDEYWKIFSTKENIENFLLLD